MRRNLSETDRKKNQFDKEERVHLLSLMKQYAPLLDKSTSTLARRKIWTTIENEFKQMGFTRKTSAQLKKYWQNYKYHCKKAKAMGKQSKKCGNSSGASCESHEWNRYRIKVESRSASKFSTNPDDPAPIIDRFESSPIPPGCRTTETCEDSSVPSFWKLTSSNDMIDSLQIKTEKEDDDSASNDYANPGTADPDLERSETGRNDHPASSLTDATTDRNANNRIVVSNANISNNSVTVSVLYPENNERVSRNAVGEGETREFHPDMVPLLANHSADTLWRSREQKRISRDTIERNGRVDLRESNSDPAFSYMERDSLDRAEEDSRDLHGKCPDELSRGNARSVSVENREKKVTDASRKYSDAEHDSLGSKKGYVLLTDYRNQLKHRLLLQQLETEEKRLKVKIAEMGIQELQLRIRALREDMRRTEELHRLNLTRAAAGDINL